MIGQLTVDYVSQYSKLPLTYAHVHVCACMGVGEWFMSVLLVWVFWKTRSWFFFPHYYAKHHEQTQQLY